MRTSKERVDHNEIIKFVATCVIQPYILLGEELPSNPWILSFSLKILHQFPEGILHWSGLCVLFFCTVLKSWDQIIIQMYLFEALLAAFCISPSPSISPLQYDIPSLPLATHYFVFHLHHAPPFQVLHFAPNCFIEFTIPRIGNVSWDKSRICNFDINSMGPTINV